MVTTPVFAVITKPLKPVAPVIAPSIAIPPIPVISPVVEISQSEELMATVAELFPIVVIPVEDKVVKAPEFGVVDPIVPGIAHVPPNKVDAFSTPLPEKVKVAPVPTVMVAVVFAPLAIVSKEGEPPVESAEHSQTSVVSFHFNTCASEQP